MVDLVSCLQVARYCLNLIQNTSAGDVTDCLRHHGRAKDRFRGGWCHCGARNRRKSFPTQKSQLGRTLKVEWMRFYKWKEYYKSLSSSKHLSPSFFCKVGHSQPLFIYFRLFNTVDRKQMLYINFVNDWIRTLDLWYHKRPLYQLSHYHCPSQSFSCQYLF